MRAQPSRLNRMPRLGGRGAGRPRWGRRGRGAFPGIRGQPPGGPRRARPLPPASGRPGDRTRQTRPWRRDGCGASARRLTRARRRRAYANQGSQPHQSERGAGAVPANGGERRRRAGSPPQTLGLQTLLPGGGGGDGVAGGVWRATSAGGARGAFPGPAVFSGLFGTGL